MQRIHCISGLAADHSLFQHLSVEGYELVPLPWVPYTKDYDMRSYAFKMAAQINEANAIVIGLSFGGMLATEMAEQFPSWKIFLVSSAKTSAELGYDNTFLRWVSKLEIVPAAIFKIPYYTTLYLLGADNSEEKKLLRQVMKDSDAAFTKWCVNTLLNWHRNTFTKNITHIHGTNDKVIRSANVHPDYWINDGSHIMIYNRGAEISKIISDCLKKL